MTAPRRRKAKRNGPKRALLYVRVSTDEQAKSGLSLEAQRATLLAEAERRTDEHGRPWEVVAVLVDEISAKRGNRRPAFEQARTMLAADEADVLMSTRLDRLSRSVVDFADLMASAQDERWQVVALDLGLDTSTTTGRMVAHILAAVAEAEREVIGQRTSAALVAKRQRGEHVGRRSTLHPHVVAAIVRSRADGATLQAIADELNATGVPTGQKAGARWHPSTVSAVLRSQAAEQVTSAPTPPVRPRQD